MNDYILNSIEGEVLVTMNNVPNTSAALADIFAAIGEQRINVDMICQTAPYKGTINLSFTIGEEDLAKTLSVTGALRQRFGDLVTEVSGGNTKITIFSELLKTESGVAARLFGRLRDGNWNVKLITTSDVEISLLVDESQAGRIIKELKAEFCPQG